MCGIVGIFDHLQNARSWSDAALEKMVSTLRHRGPDGKGLYKEPGIFLGHTRLSVIDLSERGAQPMRSASDRYVITFNGEIYNYRELRRQLQALGYSFRSESDTEVLLTAWEEWGEESLSLLDGMFAFAIYDRKGKSLVLARDAVGIKPLFYSIQGGEIYFASEPAALFSDLFPTPEYDPEALDCYFTFNYVSAPCTGYKGVFALHPGSYLVVDRQGSREHRFWKPRYCAEDQIKQEDLTTIFESVLEQSVADQLVADAPVATFLSGGLDSFAVSEVAARYKTGLSSFTLGFPEAALDERKAAREYADYLKIQHHAAEFVWNQAEIVRCLSAMRELHADPSNFPMYQLCRFARMSTVVALSGDGGDELLAGYDTYRVDSVLKSLRLVPKQFTKILRSALSWLPNDSQRYGMRMVATRLLDASEEPQGRDHASLRRIFSTPLKRSLLSPSFLEEIRASDPIGDYARHLNKVPPSRSYLCQRQHADFTFHLPSILQKVDRMSMAHGLEVRVPLLSRGMVELCQNLPDREKRRGREGKIILRRVLRSKIPAHSLERKKAGFLPSVDAWFRRGGIVNEVFGDYLLSGTRQSGILNRTAVERLWMQHQNGVGDHGYVLLSVLQFLNWSKV